MGGYVGEGQPGSRYVVAVSWVTPTHFEETWRSCPPEFRCEERIRHIRATEASRAALLDPDSRDAQDCKFRVKEWISPFVPPVILHFEDNPSYRGSRGGVQARRYQNHPYSIPGPSLPPSRARPHPIYQARSAAANTRGSSVPLVDRLGSSRLDLATRIGSHPLTPQSASSSSSRLPPTEPRAMWK